jgi:hypothetical protein
MEINRTESKQKYKPLTWSSFLMCERSSLPKLERATSENAKSLHWSQRNVCRLILCIDKVIYNNERIFDHAAFEVSTPHLS